MSFLQVHAVHVNRREIYERRFTHLHIDSCLLLFLALFCNVINLLLAACMQGGSTGKGDIFD
jgi:hypothetical protein